MPNNKPPEWIFHVLVLLGLWLISAPAAFGFSSGPLLYSDLLSGLLLIVLGLTQRRNPTACALWAGALVGIWLQLAPLVFWAKTSGAYLNNTLVGALVFILSVVLFPLPKQMPDEEPTIPPGWSYNPSSWAQRMPIALFAYLCWMISRYMAAFQLGYIDTVWDPFFIPGTKAVLESDVSRMFPVSDAGLGAFAYALEFLFTCQGGKARWRTSPWGVLLFGVLVIPVSLVSVCLIILQPLVVGSWCTLCLVTAVLMLLPIPLAVDEVIASVQYLRHSKEKPFLALLFQGGLCPSAKTDTRTPPHSASLAWIGKASLWGVSFPWNLVVSVIPGVCLMAYPSYLHLNETLFDADPVLGALTVVVSVLSFSEFLRKIRWLNGLFALILFVLACAFPSHFLLHIATALAIGLLCLRKGIVRESVKF